MFSAAKLTPEQKAALVQWAAEGATMADLQRRLREEFEIGITYMDTRILVLDLGLELQETPKPQETKPLEPQPAPAPAGTVSVSMDHLAVPGSLVSGKVTFSDGQGAVWLIDQTGRLGFDPDTAGYRPAREDSESFQRQLSGILEKAGF